MPFTNLIFEKKGAIAIVTFNKPEALNILTAETWAELDTLIDQVRDDADIQVLVFTGAGDKAFVAGADIKALQERSMVETINSLNFSVLNRLSALEIITIAAINGFALGGGCELAMACDIRIAAENARLGQPELNLGILPGAGGTQRLTRLVGPAKAKELMLTGDIIDAKEALRIGLVNRMVDVGQVVPEAEKMAKAILAKGPLAVRLCKLVVDRGAEVGIEAGLALENMAQTVIFGSQDRNEGLAAFLEKRKPDFEGR